VNLVRAAAVATCCAVAVSHVSRASAGESPSAIDLRLEAFQGWGNGALKRSRLDDLESGPWALGFSVGMQLPLLKNTWIFRTISVGPRTGVEARIWGTHNLFLDTDAVAMFRVPLAEKWDLHSSSGAGVSLNGGEQRPMSFEVQQSTNYGPGVHALLGLGIDRILDRGGWTGEIRLERRGWFVHHVTSVDTRTGETATLRQELSTTSLLGGFTYWIEL
jgi:hypothetical protein